VIETKGRRLLNTPLWQRMMLGVSAALLAFATPVFAGTWKHEVTPNNGDELTDKEDGKSVFYLGCGRGFALQAKYQACKN
jgi:hypothetical protein